MCIKSLVLGLAYSKPVGKDWDIIFILATCCEELTHWKIPDAGKD